MLRRLGNTVPIDELITVRYTEKWQYAEVLLHEAAHLSVAGEPLLIWPSPRCRARVRYHSTTPRARVFTEAAFDRVVSDWFDKVSVFVADAAELDAAVTTQLAGEKLGLWRKGRRVAQVNVQGPLNVPSELGKRRSSPFIDRQSEEVAAWYTRTLPLVQKELRHG